MNDQFFSATEHMFAIFALLLKDVIFVTDPLRVSVYPAYRFEGWLLFFHGILWLKYCSLLYN